MNQQLTLYELNHLVRSALELTMPEGFWVKAELSEVRESRGHCYLEFVQKDARGTNLIAKARGQIWASTWSFLRPYFEHTTGQRLSPGMQVLVKANVTFHELYGFSLNVTEIDPTFTLGDISRRRQEILNQLREEGVDQMNKELPLPRLLQRIAIISSATAAGYGDFCNQLANNARGLAFHTELFPATMQGNDVERSIIAALSRIAEDIDRWDAVVIIRGGGATSDLSGFDTLALAENVAQFPLPIITGIGHERDDTVIDIVAHTRVKTPTAAAELLIHHQENELNLIENLSADIIALTTQRLTNESQRLRVLTSKIPLLFSNFKAREMLTLNRLEMLLQTTTEHFFERQRNRLNLMESKAQAASPDRILRLGFSIARVNGKAISDIKQITVDDIVETTFANGTIKSKVIEKEP